jgi:hypothetical protein
VEESKSCTEPKEEELDFNEDISEAWEQLDDNLVDRIVQQGARRLYRRYVLGKPQAGNFMAL